MSETNEYPSANFVKVSSYRIAPAIVTIMVLIIVIALGYLLIKWLNRRMVSCTKAPSKPQNVIAGYLNRAEFGVAWDKAANTDSYVVKISEIRNFTNEETLAQLESIDTELNVRGLELGRTYYIRVAAENSCGVSSDSDSITYIFVEA